MRFTEVDPPGAPRVLRDTRGSATSEGVIIAPVLVLLFAAVLWAGARYQTERRNAAEAHRRPWAPALAGCAEGAADPAVVEALAGYDGRLSAAVPRLRRDLDRVVSREVARSRTDEVQRPAPLGGGALELREDTRVGCNTVGVTWSEEEIADATLDEFCRLTPYCDPR